MVEEKKKFLQDVKARLASYLDRAFGNRDDLSFFIKANNAFLVSLSYSR